MIGAISSEAEFVNEYMPHLEKQAKYGMNSEHRHGYGVSYFKKDTLHARKELDPIWDRKNNFDLDDHGNILILHARKASVGNLAIENLHPYSTKMDDKTFIFAHNGTVKDIRKMGINTNLLDNGETTDSKIIMDIIMNEYQISQNMKYSIEEAIENISHTCDNIASVNFIASDGIKLYALRYYLEDENYYTMWYKKIENGYVISTEKFEDEEYEWELIPNKTLMIFTPKDIEEVSLD